MEKKISIVTPVYNGEEFIEKCILSIMNQNYNNYEHIIMDGGSNDRTLEIIKKYEGLYPMKVISQKDNGMYDAIVNGFNVADGEIYAWLNSDDTYMPWAFQIMNYAMSQNIDWCTTINADQNEFDVFYAVYNAKQYKREWIIKGMYDSRMFGVIQQEVTFWTKQLWEKSLGEQIAKYKYAGDFALWKLFAKHADLYTMTTVIGGFRIHPGQKSSDLAAYYNEIECNYSMNRVVKRFYKIQDFVFQKQNKYLLWYDK